MDRGAHHGSRKEMTASVYTEQWLADRLARQGAKASQGSSLAPKTVSEPQKPNKYRARKTEVDGIIFDSGREAARYQELRLLEKAGEISNLELQVKFSLDIEGVHICSYEADFCYNEKGQVIVEDSKGVRTPSYRIKAKLMWALYRIRIRET
jgi:hypothetical protein